MALAINASLHFVKAARTGTLWAEARKLSKNAKLGSYAVEVRDNQGELIAPFQGIPVISGFLSESQHVT